MSSEVTREGVHWGGSGGYGDAFCVHSSADVREIVDFVERQVVVCGAQMQKTNHGGYCYGHRGLGAFAYCTVSALGYVCVK